MVFRMHIILIGRHVTVLAFHIFETDSKMVRDQRKRGSLETNIPAMHCGYIIRKFAHQAFCTAHNIAGGGQCYVKVHKQSTVVNVMPNDKKMNHI